MSRLADEATRFTPPFEHVVEAAPSAMLVVDGSGTIVFVNRQTEVLFGYLRDQLVGQPVGRLLPERLRTQHAEDVRRFFAAPSVRQMGAGRELFGQHADGSEVPVEIGLSPMQTAEGSVILASVIDITERKRAIAAQERLASIVESSLDAIFSKTLDGIVTSWNRSAERLFGYSAAEVIGQHIMLLVPDRLADEEARILSSIRRNERVEPFTTRRRTKAGPEVDVSVTVSPIRNAANEVVGASSIVRDISEIVRRDAELRRSNAELEQFAHIASHDLQEPLRMVANYTELLADRYKGRLDEKADTYIHYASDGARRMQQLVSDLLAYSRVGLQQRPLTPVSVATVVENVSRSLQRLIVETGAVIEGADLPTVMGDEVQLAQLFQNLIGNAIKFRSDATPHVVVRALRTADRWEFSVRDNGIGIDPRYAERVFQMFQRLHERGRYPGSGIGLSIARRIVERHGGTMWLESQPHVGTTFHFTLPTVPTL